MWKRWARLFGLVVVVLGIAALPSVAGPTDSAQPDGAVSETGLAQSSVDCASCHDDPTKQAFPNSDVCSSCHPLIGGDYQGSIHSVKTDTAANFDCLQCHEEPEDSWFMHFQNGPHGSQKPGISMAPEDTCAATGCHDSHNPYGAIYAEWSDGPEGESGLSHSAPAPSTARSAECSPCHGTHEGTFENIEGEPGIEHYALADQPDAAEVSEWRVTCAACHDPHDVRAGDNLRGDFDEESRLCAQCHNGPNLGPSTADHGPVHNSIWQLYSGSKFADATGTHPELDCSSCHMAGQANTDEYNARTGHSFDVNTTLLADTDRLHAPESQQCGSCHTDLAGSIAGSQASIDAHLDSATRLQAEANATLEDLGMSDDAAMRSAMNEGATWIELVASPTVGIHDPDVATDGLLEAIERFESVKAAAYENRSVADDGDTSETATATPTPTDTPTTGPTTETATPGPGIGATLVVVVSAMLLARRHRNG